MNENEDQEKINSIEYKMQILNDIIQRIKNTRPEYKNDGVNYAAIALKKQELNVVCHKCRNNNVNNMQKVRHSLAVFLNKLAHFFTAGKVQWGYYMFRC